MYIPERETFNCSHFYASSTLGNVLLFPPTDYLIFFLLPHLEIFFFALPVPRQYLRYFKLPYYVGNFRICTVTLSNCNILRTMMAKKSKVLNSLYLQHMKRYLVCNLSWLQFVYCSSSSCLALQSFIPFIGLGVPDTTD